DAAFYATSVRRRWDQQCLLRFRSRFALRFVVNAIQGAIRIPSPCLSVSYKHCLEGSKEESGGEVVDKDEIQESRIVWYITSILTLKSHGFSLDRTSPTLAC
ncbi:hypothetical protein DMN91_006918, partial [Ooceraea biroi]